MWTYPRLLPCILLAAASPAAAWNGKGHMMVAAIAWQTMDATSRTRAARLIRLNPHYAKWTAKIPKSKKAQVAFVRAATWPDEIKSAPDYVNDGNEPPAVPASSQNIGYGDKLQHRYWHFKDVPFSPDGTPTKEPADPNAATRITLFRAALADPATSNGVKSYDLSWLLHLVGDVHQPLHATSRFTAATPEGDNGGNDVLDCLPAAKLCDAQHAGRLHGFWDSALGSTTDAQVAIAEARELELPASGGDEADVDTWINESVELAKSAVYQPPIEGQTGPYRLTDAYRVAAAKLARERIALAGVRLGHLVQDAFGAH